MRLFFAIQVPYKLQLQIVAWRERNLPPMPRYVPAANYHITLAFLGQLPTNRLDALIESASQLIDSAQFRAGTLNIDQTGYWSKPGILWIGPKEWPDSLNTMAKRLGGLGQQFGLRVDKRRYQPHLTLARKCELPAKPTSEPGLTLPYDEIVLYESVSRRDGVNYEPVQEWPLLQAARGKLPRRVGARQKDI